MLIVERKMHSTFFLKILSTSLDCGVSVSCLDIFIMCLEGGSIISLMSWISCGSYAVARLCTSPASLSATSASCLTMKLFGRRKTWH